VGVPQTNDKYWHPSNEINLKKESCGCVMEMGFAGDEVFACHIPRLCIIATRNISCALRPHHHLFASLK
jgi:hypothetical protein